jgi:hypothetical protein
MNSSRVDSKSLVAADVRVTAETLAVDLSDGRKISVPPAGFPRLLSATPKERKNWRLIGDGVGVHWPDLDEDVSVGNLLAGKPSGESRRSFERWSARRGAATAKPTQLAQPKRRTLSRKITKRNG